MIEAKDHAISSLKDRVTLLEEKVDKLNEALDSAESSDRRDTLVISGDIPAASAGENCKLVVLELIKEQLNLVVADCDVSYAQRIGKKAINQVTDRRNLMFKLCRRDLKLDIMQACRRLRPRFYINVRA